MRLAQNKPYTSLTLNSIAFMRQTPLFPDFRQKRSLTIQYSDWQEPQPIRRKTVSECERLKASDVKEKNGFRIYRLLPFFLLYR